MENHNPKKKKRLPNKYIYLPFIFGIAFSLASNLFGWDLAFQEWFRDPLNEQWTGRDKPLYTWLYHYGIVPALVVAVVSLITLILSYNLRRLIFTRRVAAYLFLLLALGNGLVTNGILKEYWGRPRPSQIIQFGGTEQFEPSLTQDFVREGKSFPGGHATMGFYFLGVALLFTGRARIFWFLFALIFGGAISVARSSYGGHFLTDNVWAGIVMWLTSVFLFRVFHLHEGLRYIEQPARSAFHAWRRKWAGIALLPMVIVLVVGVTVATPRDKTETVQIKLAEESPIQTIHLDISGGLVVKTEKPDLLCIARGVGFGFPKTRLMLRLVPSDVPGKHTLQHYVRGFFSDLQATTTLHLPAGYQYEINYDPEYVSGLILDGTIENTDTGTKRIDLRSAK
ncbi:MAG: phosphatase PAP2 family protein [Coraliomargarita sp. TMED73]|nr:MAG: phosphatase PAP2 family protein [Coraliomargarita sp. TMED73]|tara:strand:- start:24251 stop:25438 length:1188 start_codon:yes stop_codon:yes gene_type:complete